MRAAKLITTAAALVGVALLPSAHATTLSFESLATSGFGNKVQNGYGGLQWSNFYYLDGNEIDDVYGANGYTSAHGTGSKVAYNGFGNYSNFYSATAFNFNSVSLGGAWRNGLQVNIVGFVNDTDDAAFNTTVTVNSGAASTFTFNWTNLRYVFFGTSGGVNPGYTLDGGQFVLDNVSFEPVPTDTGTPTGTTFAPSSNLARQSAIMLAPAAVPEPTGWAMLIAGVGVLGIALRRRSRRLGPVATAA